MVAQAVSWPKAIQTNVWSASDRRAPSAVPPRFDFRQIHELVRQARSGREGWERWFQAHHIEPLPVRYEDLVADMSGTTRRAFSFLGIEYPADLAVQVRTSRQANSINHDWAARYRDILTTSRG